MMYTGNYYPSEDQVKLPRDYSGNAFSEEASAKQGIDNEEEATAALGGTRTGGIFDSLASVFPLGRMMPEGIRDALHLDKFKLGSEELLIIALAVFLLLSRDGDKECAIILFLLLFIN